MPTSSGIEYELYDLAADPGEKNNLADSKPEQLAAMKTKLFAFLLTRPGWTMAGDYYLPAQVKP